MALLGPPLSDKYTQTYFFSSDPANEALNVSSDGRKFSVQLSAPISVPAGSRACELAVITGAIWNTTPTVGPGLGPAGVDDNKFSYTTSVAPAGTYSITFPTGQYSLTAIGQYLATQFKNNGHPTNLFVLGGQEATGLASVTIQTEIPCALSKWVPLGRSWGSPRRQSPPHLRSKRYSVRLRPNSIV